MSRILLATLIVLSILFSSMAQTQTQPKSPKDDVPGIYNSGTEKGQSPPKTAAEIAASVPLPPGFKANVFAAEPDVRNPLAMAWDAQGRLWVAENYTYAEQAMRWDEKLRDRIVIFEDKTGKGSFTSRKVFVDNLEKLMSVEVGLGGVWVMTPPRLLFIPDRNSDGVPDGPAQVMLDGFNVSPTGPYHTIANGLRFGPDGWLYGRCGCTNPGEIGPPGTPAAERTPLRGTIWRYHPTRKVVEVVSYGTTNPWGHDWDEHGELFFINTTNGHFFHDFPGAHYTRGTTKDPNPRAYELIDMHADHRRSGKYKAGTFNNGHAHVGMTIYQGDNWPDEYRGHVLSLNLFGHRINQEIIERTKGSGYVAHTGDDMVNFPDPWFRGIDLSYGPDGAVYILDWSDDGENHERTGVHRDSGRIYRVAYGATKPNIVGDVSKLNVDQLVALHSHRNEWYPRQARLELTARFLDGRGVGNAKEQLRALYANHASVPMKLRALWTLYDIGALDDAFLLSLLRDPDEHIRVWGIRLLTNFWPIDNVMSKRPAQSVAGAEVTPSPALLSEFVRLAKEDSSGLVRLGLASTLQRLPVTLRFNLASALVGRAEDARDYNLPLLIWYGLIPIADENPSVLMALASQCELPKTRTYIARRLAEELDKNSAVISQLLEFTMLKTEDYQVDIVSGLSQGLKGGRKAPMPAAWEKFAVKLNESTNVALRNSVRDLSVILGDPKALAEARKAAIDPAAEMNSRKTALQAVIDSRPPDLRQLCEELLTVRGLNAVAARGLATFDDPAIGHTLVKSYEKFDVADRPVLISTLVSRPSYAAALLVAVANKKIPRTEISAFDARQIQSLSDVALNKKLIEVWGEVRESPAEKKQLVMQWKAQLTPNVLAKADKSQGRLLFNKTCATCHVLYGEGSKIGPDLTGGGRQILDFLLAKIADPSAAVAADYRMSIVSLKNGQFVNGIIAAQTDRIMTINTATGPVTVNRDDVENVRESTQSLMPEGILSPLTAEQVRDLIAYLSYPTQVPFPASK